MKARLVSSVALAAVVATAASGIAAQPRRAMLGYAATDDNFTVGAPDEYTVVGTGDPEANYDFEILKGETSVTAMILDDSERPVSGIVTQWKPVGSQEAGPASATTYEAVTWKRFCEKTAEPVALKPKLPVRIIVMEGTCKDGTPSVPTTGDIVVDFHRS
jgi:hypothetical protein